MYTVCTLLVFRTVETVDNKCVGICVVKMVTHVHTRLQKAPRSLLLLLFLRALCSVVYEITHKYEWLQEGQEDKAHLVLVHRKVLCLLRERISYEICAW